MTAFAEQGRALEANANFQYSLKGALSRATADLQYLRVLIQGASSTRFKTTHLLSDIRLYQSTYILEPSLVEESEYSPFPGNIIKWSNKFPQNQTFELGVFNFSMHNIEEAPEEAVKRLSDLGIRRIAIAEYDFTASDLEQFKAGFQAQTEQEDLHSDPFRGDWQVCFEHHSQNGVKIYKEALEANGFRVERTETGEGIAKNKFFIIGKKN